MTPDPGSSNPFQDLLERAKKLFSDSDGDSPKPKRHSPHMRNEAEQREADDRFEEQKAKDAERANR